MWTPLEREGGILRQGVKSMTFRLATNFCISALNMPCRATMYPGRLTHTTSSTASKTSKTRWPNEGCEECGGSPPFFSVIICACNDDEGCDDMAVVRGPLKATRGISGLALQKYFGKVKSAEMARLERSKNLKVE